MRQSIIFFYIDESVTLVKFVHVSWGTGNENNSGARRTSRIPSAVASGRLEKKSRIADELDFFFCCSLL